MPKQRIKPIIVTIIVIAMLSILKNMFVQTDDTALREAVKKGAFIVDVRTPAEFSGGSVKGAVNIPLDKIPSQLSKFKGKENIILFCRSGARSSQAKRILDQNGFKNVINGGTWENVQQAFNQ